MATPFTPHALAAYLGKLHGRPPSEVRATPLGAVRESGELEPLGNAEELFMLAEFVDGQEYADDLLRLRASGA